ncbi:TatD family hydrolase [Candidatus Peregrinibacteria bacterium]|nr:TatD family hydrolase [Candidatus Peregrinibacteria bacterium]
MLIDAHAHIHVKNFDADRNEVIQRALDAGVKRIIEVGFDSEGIFKALALAKAHDWIYAAIGIHPHLASEWNNDTASKIRKLAKPLKNEAHSLRSCVEDKIVAIGETGLDYYKNFQPREIQQKVFREQLRIASEVGLPVIIHCRDAYKDLFRILDEEKFSNGVLLHCFTGTREEAEEGIRRGGFIAFTGVITYPNAKSLREIAEKAPIDKIFIESDCPFLSPQKYRGKRNEPSYIVETAKTIAQIKKISIPQLEKQIECNVKSFFSV